ncbi:MAG: sodium:solute symporter [Planctomycetes bacterium]|nr:sodium:solute symporter [Planctomycetota bacterium]
MPIGSLDITIVAAYLLAMIGLGVHLGRGHKNAKDYLLGGRDLPWVALLVSIVATETSTVTFLSVPGLVFGDGVPGSPGDLRYMQLPLGFLVGRVIAARLLLPSYFRGELFTAYEVLQARFGAVVRGIASTLFLVMRTLGDGLRLYLTAKVASELADVSLGTAVIATGASTLLYTWFGGVRAVVWTDVLQFVVYMAGAFVAAALLWHDVGDRLGGLLASDAGAGHLRFVSFEATFADPYTFHAGLVGGAFLSLGSHGVDHLVVQRYLCARSRRDAQKALIASGVVVWMQFAVFLGIGLLLWAFYRLNPPERPFADNDRVFVDYLVHHMPTGLRGLVIGAVFAAAMSTLSGSLNSSASALVNDILLPLRQRSATDPCALPWARRATLLFGALQIGAALVACATGFRGATIDAVLAIASFTTGILLGLFFLARLARHADARAATAALIGGAVVTASARFVLPAATDLRIAGIWFGAIGALSTLACGLAASRVRKRRSA